MRKLIICIISIAIIMQLLCCGCANTNVKQETASMSSDITSESTSESGTQDSVSEAESNTETLPVETVSVPISSIEPSTEFSSETEYETESETATKTEIRYGILGEEDAAIFACAVNLHPEFEPVALIGKQIVAGINYMYLCHEIKTEDKYALVVVYEDFNGKIQVTDIYDFSFEETEGGELCEEIAGGWNPVSEYFVINLPDNLQNNYESLSDANEIITYDALAAVRRGDNWFVVSRVTDRNNSEVKSGIKIVEFAEVEGHCELKEEKNINLARY